MKRKGTYVSKTTHDVEYIVTRTKKIELIDEMKK